MRIPTIRIRNKVNGKVMTVNEHDWARDLGLGLFRGWERAGGATHVKQSDREVEAAVKLHDSTAFDRPAHIINDAPKSETATPKPEAKPDLKPESKGRGKDKAKDAPEKPAADLTFSDALKEISANEE